MITGKIITAVVIEVAAWYGGIYLLHRKFFPRGSAQQSKPGTLDNRKTK